MDPTTLLTLTDLPNEQADAALAQVGALIGKHRDSLRDLGVAVDDAQFGLEIRTLPGKYAPDSRGQLILAKSGTRVLGCIALRAIDLPDHTPGATCEIKRLFVAHEARGAGLGLLLVRRIQDEAVALGYEYAVLDTLHRLPHAEALYRMEGFSEIPRYNDNSMPDIVFLGKPLQGYTAATNAQASSPSHILLATEPSLALVSESSLAPESSPTLTLTDH